jgi:hypothetical protein
MARGFESKSVADQQEAAQNARPPAEKGIDPRRRSLELARTDVARRLEGATSGPHREMLQRALDDLDERLRRLAVEPPAEPPPQE